MEKQYHEYTMTDEEIRQFPFIDKNGSAAFYRFMVEKVCGENFDAIDVCDCREIDVAPNITESWFDFAVEQEKEKFKIKNGFYPQDYDDTQIRAEFAMFLAMYGPKSPEDLKPNTVRYTNDFITL